MSREWNSVCSQYYNFLNKKKRSILPDYIYIYIALCLGLADQMKGFIEFLIIVNGPLDDRQPFVRCCNIYIYIFSKMELGMMSYVSGVANYSKKKKKRHKAYIQLINNIGHNL